ncbi:MAG: hypothetical protein ABIZ05_01620 [Pseudonocardiaceae bacterium]
MDFSGWAVPGDVTELIGNLRAQVPGLAEVTLSAHHHNDLGLATANALNGVRAGAGQGECTVNRLGERAGNTALEQFVMLLSVRSDRLGLRTRINPTELLHTAKLVADRTGYPVAADQSIVGRNTLVRDRDTPGGLALRDPATYRHEVLDGEAGTLGKHTTLADLRAALVAAGYPVTSHLLRDAFRRLNELSDNGAVAVDVDQLVAGASS